MLKGLTVAYEFATLYIDGERHNEDDISLPTKTFDNFWNLILSGSMDGIASVHTRGGNKYIKLSRYVGTIQTRDGHIIEVLPKIYKKDGDEYKDPDKCRKVLFTMLRSSTDSKAKSFQDAEINTEGDFPILEYYIRHYIDSVESLLQVGLKKDYTRVCANEPFLKGKLDFRRQVTENLVNKARFAIVYNKYLEDIPYNRIIVTTLKYLTRLTHSFENNSRLNYLISCLSDIPTSSNIAKDIKAASSSNRLFASYDKIINWSAQILANKGFTPSSGNCLNISLMFRAEKLFEDFIYKLFQKYATNYSVYSQHRRYYLVDKHEGKGLFMLRPDIVMENNDEGCIIIDTKWKVIDAEHLDKTYLIDISDMYQLYAYGQKYRYKLSTGKDYDVIPNLVLIYPCSEKFTQPLPEFVYDEVKNRYNLKLHVVPFDLTGSTAFNKQVKDIIDSVTASQTISYQFKNNGGITLPMVAENERPIYEKPSKKMIVGCYNRPSQLTWIEDHKMYNARLEKNYDLSSVMVSASRLLLYDYRDTSKYFVYDVDPSKQILADQVLMESYGYDRKVPGRKYILYLLGDLVKDHPDYDVNEIKRKNNIKINDFKPFIVEYKPSENL